MMTTETIRHKGRDYHYRCYEIGWGTEVFHRVEIVISPRGRNVRIWLDNERLVTEAKP